VPEDAEVTDLAPRRGYLWQRLREEIAEEFAELVGPSLTERGQLNGAWDDWRIGTEERAAARTRIGEEWSRKLVLAAKSYAGSASAAARRARMTPTQVAIAERREARKQRRAGSAA
jgi:hypothetical protein